MNSAKQIAAGLLALGMLPVGAAQADTVFGFYAGAGTWQQEVSGDVTSGISNVDIEEDLGLDDDDNVIIYAAFEHGVPLLPNIRAQHFSIDINGANTLSRTIEFNGQVFSVADDVATVIDLTQTDAVFYYEVLDNVVSLDLGIAVSLMDGSLQVASSVDGAKADFDEVIPMLYGKVRADLPLTGLWVGAEAQGISYDDSSLIEFNAQIGYESNLGLGIEAGYRSVQLDFDDIDDVDNADVEVSGPYAAINYHF